MSLLGRSYRLVRSRVDSFIVGVVAGSRVQLCAIEWDFDLGYLRAMRDLRPCPSCQRHVAVQNGACPFCDSTLDIPFSRLRAPGIAAASRAGPAAAIALGLAMSACYGGPPPNTPKSSSDSVESMTTEGDPSRPPTVTPR